MTKQELIKAIVLRRDYRFTHDELMGMNKAQLLHIYNGCDAILKVPKYPLSILGDLLNNPPIHSLFDETMKHQ